MYRRLSTQIACSHHIDGRDKTVLSCLVANCVHTDDMEKTRQYRASSVNKLNGYKVALDAATTTVCGNIGGTGSQHCYRVMGLGLCVWESPLPTEPPWRTSKILDVKLRILMSIARHLPKNRYNIILTCAQKKTTSQLSPVDGCGCLWWKRFLEKICFSLE